MKDDYQVGETVGIYYGNHKGELTEGKVVAFLDLPGWMHRHYVIELETSIDPLLEVRCSLGMRPASFLEVEMQTCEHCSKDFPIESMRMMSECWFCEACTDDFHKHFETCDHKWSPHTDEHGDAGKYCENCSGFVRNEDFRYIPAPSQSPTGDRQ